ncbi:MAG: hypothetical protein K2V38_00080, partial [Gemmataceae bacterium]|nr:hypothetical protein [Gemmataceae bacterium]
MGAALIVGVLLGVAGQPDPTDTPRSPGMPDEKRDALARYGSAVWNLRRERLLTAVRQLEAAVQADPDAAEPRRELARLYAQLGRDLEAIRTARKVLDKHPADYETALLLAKLLADAGELEDAVSAAKLATESPALGERPDRAVRALRELAALSEKAGAIPTAEAALRKAIEFVTDKRAEVVKAGAFTPKDADLAAAECLERLGHVLVKASKPA